MNPKIKVARLSIASNTFLIIMKLVVGILSGSVSIISEAIHSSMDLMAAIIAYFSVKVSDNPPDSKHPYGHGKVENISGALEADALHLKTDVYTSLGVAVGLGLIAVTGIKWLDPIVAICVALLIIYESYILLKKAFWPLLDSAWNEDEIKDLERRLKQMKVNYHDLRTRVAG